MPSASPEQIMAALATQIEARLGGTATPEVENLQVTGLWNPNPTPPSIDIYPSDPFQEALTFDKGLRRQSYSVRVRVTTADQPGGQTLLLQFMNPHGDASLGQAIMSDRTLGGTVTSVTYEGPSGYGAMRDVSGEGQLLGAIWTVIITP